MKCSKCDGPHRFDQCTFKGTCLHCGKVGYKADACRSKKSGDAPKSVPSKPKARTAVSMQDDSDTVTLETVEGQVVKASGG